MTGWTTIDWDKILAILVGLATVTQAVVATVMVRGLKHSANAAEAAAETLRLAEKTSQLQLRAYIQVVKTEFTGFKCGEPAIATVELKNTGQTPAKDFRVYMTPHYARAADLSGLPQVTPARGEPTTVGAGASQWRWSREFIEDWEPHIEALRSKELKFLVQGAFSYIDVFGHPHSGTFLMECRDGLEHKPGGRLDLVSVGNTAD